MLNRIKVFLCLALGGILSSGQLSLHAQAVPGDDRPDALIGERLFRETRFSQFFFAHCHGDANAALQSGDPVMEKTETTGSALPGSFAGQGMNCRACHLVDEHKAALGNRTYSDFARRSPIPDRGDGRPNALRNAPGLVSAMPGHGGGAFLHLDGEFVSTEDLVVAGLTGRNNGWLPNEREIAVAHIGRIIRDDKGTGELAREFGGSYRLVLKGTDPSIPRGLRLPGSFRLDVANATDQDILNAIGKLMKAYLDGLTFSKDIQGRFNGSPYDQFLIKNNLPRTPRPGESPLAYSRRLLRTIEAWPNLQFVKASERKFRTHDQPYVFGEQELAGLKIFFRTPPGTALNPERFEKGGAGNCIACHQAPAFSDFKFHNTGASQEEYDATHGKGSFASLPIPGLTERDANPDAFLPPTGKHPKVSGVFAAIPSAAKPGHVDLGLWNVFANLDFPKPQQLIRESLTDKSKAESDAVLLERSVACFKTPALRDLGQSAPYLHNGSKDTIEGVVSFYRKVSRAVRAGEVRNADPEMSRIALSDDDEAALAAFLRSLNEDYEK